MHAETEGEEAETAFRARLDGEKGRAPRRQRQREKDKLCLMEKPANLHRVGHDR